MTKIHANGIQFHYITVGHGTDVVMLHGFLGNLAVWHLEIVPALRRNFRITTYDLRGHGYSDVTPDGYTCQQQARDLKGLLDGLGIKRPILVGHSFGADVALYFSYLYPERVPKLIAIEPGLAALVHQRKHKEWPGWTPWVARLEELGQTVPPDKRNDVNFLLDLSLKTPKIFGPLRGLPRNREPLLNLIRNTTLVQDYEHVGELTLEAVRSIRTPTLLIYGEKSHFISSFEYLRGALPDCKPVLLPGGEHFGPLETPELLTGHIRRFLEEHTSRPVHLEHAEWAASAASGSV